jgi:aspartate-semialdehyde dehydrogenase
VDLAVVGATGLVGEALLDLLPSSGLRFDRIHALASAASVGRRVACGERHLTVAELGGFDFGAVSRAVFAVPRDVAARHLPRAIAAGCGVVDASTAWLADVDDPLFHPAGAPPWRATAAAVPVLCLPGPHAAVVAEVLGALRPLARPTFLSVVGFRAASDRGRAGVSALARETADLLNARPRQPTPFAQQLAFNLIPADGTAGSGEPAVAAQLARLVGEPDLPVDVTLVEVPSFYGAAAVLHVGIEDPVTVEEAREALAATPGIVVADPDDEGQCPTPVGHSAGSEEVFVSRVRPLAAGNGLVLWILADNIRCGLARNALRALAALVGGDG